MRICRVVPLREIHVEYFIPASRVTAGKSLGGEVHVSDIGETATGLLLRFGQLSLFLSLLALVFG